jgi:hypothetical protein
VTVGRGEVRVIGSNDQIARIHERQTEACNRPLNLRHQRLRHLVQLFDCRVQSFNHPVKGSLAIRRRPSELLGERPDVATGHEMLAGAAQHHHLQRIIVRDFGGARDKRVHHREVERVERIGPVQGQRGDRAVAGEQYRRVHRELANDAMPPAVD